ncbi:hypothetical protein NQZ79_g3379 [Umbelopsis isabellina]|nr:hypothetical protein NQZ79_g3379 [Umbelopsis isabellina]
MIKLFCITTSWINTEDVTVARKRIDTPRSQSYVRRIGIPVVDAHTQLCGICRVKVYFAILITFGTITMAWYLWQCIHILLLPITDKDTFTMAVQQYFEVDNSKTESPYFTESMLNDLAILVTALLALAVTISLGGLLRLGIFHIYLTILGITTAEYFTRNALKVKAGKDRCDLEAQDDGDTTEKLGYMSGDENDDNIWRRPWSPSTDTASSKRGYSGSIMRRIQKSWISFARHAVQPLFPSDRGNYQLVNLMPSPNINRKIPRPIKRQKQGVFPDSESDDEFGTETIRPPMPLYDGSQEPDYSQDMGLNLEILDELDDLLDQRPRSKSKARKILGFDS